MSVSYNNSTIFSGYSPPLSGAYSFTTPYVEISKSPVRLEKSFGSQETIKLNGSIVFGCGNIPASLMLSAANELSAAFSSDYKSFSGGGISRSNVKVSSVSIDPGESYRIMTYSVDLLYNDFEDGSSIILDPSLSVNYSEQEDGNITVEINSSARSATPNDFESVISYVNNKAAFANVIPPTAKIRGFSTAKMILKSRTEEINRFDGSASVSLSYICPRRGSLAFSLEQSIDVGYNEESGIAEASISGSVTGGIDSDMDEVRAAFGKINPYPICSQKIALLSLGVRLYPEAASSSISEIPTDKKITFSFSYNSSGELGLAFYDCEYSLKYNGSTSLHSVSVSGTALSKLNQKKSWINAKEIANSINLKGLCQEALSKFEASEVLLEEGPESSSYTYDERAGTVSFAATFNEKDKEPESTIPGFKNVNYSIEIQRPVAAQVPIPTITNGLKMVDLDSMKRGSITISGSTELLDGDCEVDTAKSESALRGFMDSKISSFNIGSSSFLESISITKNVEEKGDTFSFSMTKSYDGESGPFKYDN